MRGSQSDPTHTNAPRMPTRACATRALTRVGRVRARLREYHTLCLLSRAGKARVWRGYNKRFNGLLAGFWWRAMRWHRRGLLGALLGLLGALLGFAYGLQCWRGLAMPVFTVRIHSTGRLYSMQGYGLAYGLGYGIARARLALSVWLRLDRVALLSIHRIMKPC